ncbi:hypothetical protein KY342_02855 [Candidatus Woesearchaeota archaeon]|nr:hypothetical protein [Candidatus Woesearchaeota archaeon]
MEDLEVVAAQGKPVNTVGYMLPVVQDGNRCFLLGDNPDNGFCDSELDEMAEEGKITKIDPSVSMGDIIPCYEYELNKSKKPFSNDAYVFYRDGPEMDILGINQTNVRTIDTFGWRRALFPKDYGYIEAYVVDNEGLKFLLEKTFDTAAIRVFDLLRQHFRCEADKAADVLFQSAYDKKLAIEAIAYRGVIVKGTSKEKNFMSFVRSAAKPLGLSTTKNYWQSQIKKLEKRLKYLN